jgi:hypothetical protein
MSKRFIDTGIFDDPWFMDLSLSGKTLWFYCITKCDHAGILEWNKKLIQFQTGVKSLDIVTKELGNRLLRVSEQYVFIPKFFEFQYPNYPETRFKAAESAIKILEKFNLIDKSTHTVTKELPNSYGISIGNGNGNGNGNGIERESEKGKDILIWFEDFWNEYHQITGKPKTDKEATFGYWKKLSDDERKKAVLNIKAYFDSQSDKKYCKKARTYLDDKNFNDEFQPNENTASSVDISNTLFIAKDGSR